jgi:hypothetical protein
MPPRPIVAILILSLAETLPGPAAPWAALLKSPVAVVLVMKCRLVLAMKIPPLIAIS